MSQYVDALAARTFLHSTVDELARSATIPVINALSDASHPCQAMADLMTIEELRGSVAGKKLVFVGDGNNVARSLATASAFYSGADSVLAPRAGLVSCRIIRCSFKSRFPEVPLLSRITIPQDRRYDGADVVYTDVWTSMGQEHEAEARRSVFAPYQVNKELLAHARPDAMFLHCLPAHRGEEVTSDVLDGPRSQVIPQAANRALQTNKNIWLPGAMNKIFRHQTRPFSPHIPKGRDCRSPDHTIQNTTSFGLSRSSAGLFVTVPAVCYTDRVRPRYW